MVDTLLVIMLDTLLLIIIDTLFCAAFCCPRDSLLCVHLVIGRPMEDSSCYIIYLYLAAKYWNKKVIVYKLIQFLSIHLVNAHEWHIYGDYKEIHYFFYGFAVIFCGHTRVKIANTRLFWKVSVLSHKFKKLVSHMHREFTYNKFLSQYSTCHT
jgi:hypothetical protein